MPITTILTVAFGIGASIYADGPEYRWQPVEVTGAAYSIDNQRGNPGVPSEVTITGVFAEAVATFELDLSGWGDAAGSPRLATWEATIDATNGYVSGGNGVFDGVWGEGDDLGPFGAYYCHEACIMNFAHPRWVFRELQPPCLYIDENPPPHYCPDCDFEYFNFTIGCSVSDPGTIEYGGTLLVLIPPGSYGTYELPFDDSPTKTSMHDPNAQPILPLVKTPVRLTLPIGKCCSGYEPQVECVDGISETMCNALGGSYTFHVGGACTGVPSLDCLPDCNDNGILDADEIAWGLADDCNNNGGPDECDLEFGISEDCDMNLQPDECDLLESDCNANGVPDACDIREAPLWQPPNRESGAFSDQYCVPCDGDQSTADDFVLAEAVTVEAVAVWGGYYPNNDPGPSADFTMILHEDDGGMPGPVVPLDASVSVTRQPTGRTVLTVDEWHVRFNFDPPVTLESGTYWVEAFENAPGTSNTFFWETGDLDAATGRSGMAFAIETPGIEWYLEAMDMAVVLLSPSPRDCNGNGTLDECDLASGGSHDCNATGVPDECENDCNANGLADECDLDSGTSSDDNGNGIPDECEIVMNRYLLLPAASSESVAYQVEMTASAYFPDSTGVLGWVGPPDQGVSRVVAAPYFSDSWPAAVYVGDCEIVPVADYLIHPTPDGVSFGDAIALSTIAQPDKAWADVVGTKSGTVWLAPDGSVNFGDIQAAIQTFEKVANAPHWTRIDLATQTPDTVVNMTDIQFVILAFEGSGYPFADPAACP